MGFLSGITSFVKEHSEVIHGVLDVAGFIPGVGAVADLANAGLYAAEGDYLNAALSVASAIPGIGDTVALAKKSVNAVKGGLKSLKGIKNINALKKAKGIKKALAGMRGKAKTGASRLKKGKVKKKGKLEPPDEAIDAIKKDQKGLCVGDKCFTGDTLVYTKHGYKPIKEIRKGDEVYSRDEETGETSLKEVIETFRTTTHTVYHIWADGKEEFKTTAYHPVYVKEQGWVTAINLREGDTIETMDGFVHITKVERTRHEEPVAVYNFHVRDWASYFVGKIKCYVHNGPGKHPEGLEYKGDRETELFLPDEYYQKLDDNIAKAMAARDAEVARIQSLSKTQQSNVATVVAGVDIRTGDVYVGVKNSKVYKGNATCAEDIVFRGLGGNTNANIIMTPAIRPRNNEVIPVCTRCQTKYPKNQFVKGTKFQ